MKKQKTMGCAPMTCINTQLFRHKFLPEQTELPEYRPDNHLNPEYSISELCN